MAAQHTVLIEAKPGPVSVDPRETAVIVVDMQNDFGCEGGLFARAGIDIVPIRAVVPATAKVLQTARQAGVRIIYLKMEFRPDLSDLGSADSVNATRHRFF